MEVISRLLHVVPGRFSRELGINLENGPAERQKWFLAALLFGAPISGQLAARTCQVFLSQGVYPPQALLEQGWDNLVALLDAGGYARYDFKTATKLLAVMQALVERYQGDLEVLHAASQNPRDLESRLQKLASGVGPVTVNIFLRELRGLWSKAEPLLSDLATQAAGHLGLLAPGQSGAGALAQLHAHWQAQPSPGLTFADLEAALVRLGRDYCRKAKGPPCPLASWCRREACPRR
jgi:endonuclease III